MPFDGVEWSQPVFIPPYAYHAHAPLTAEVLSAGFINAYVAARRNGRRVHEQVAPFFGRSSTEGDFPQWHTATSLVPVADGYAWAQADWTHARAFVVYRAITVVDAIAYHRLVATDGSNTATGTTTEQAIATNGQLFGSPQTGHVGPTAETAGNVNGGLFGSWAEVALETLTLDQTIHLQLEGYAGVLGSGYYRFQWASIYLEARG